MGQLLGGAFNYVDQNWFGGKLPFTLHDTKPDYACLKLAADSQKIEYPKPDGKLSFDKLSSVRVSSEPPHWSFSWFKAGDKKF